MGRACHVALEEWSAATEHYEMGRVSCRNLHGRRPAHIVWRIDRDRDSDRDRDRERMAEPTVKYCRCGTLVWDVSATGVLPRYTETIICRTCGTDHSRRPPLVWRLPFAWRRLKRRRRAVGLWRMWGWELRGRRLQRVQFATGLWQVRGR